jgi:hypothetical protein
MGKSLILYQRHRQIKFLVRRCHCYKMGVGTSADKEIQLRQIAKDERLAEIAKEARVTVAQIEADTKFRIAIAERGVINASIFIANLFHTLFH